MTRPWRVVLAGVALTVVLGLAPEPLAEAAPVQGVVPPRPKPRPEPPPPPPPPRPKDPPKPNDAPVSVSALGGAVRA